MANSVENYYLSYNFLNKKLIPDISGVKAIFFNKIECAGKLSTILFRLKYNSY